MATRDEKKRKREKEKESRGDPNIDVDLIRDSSSTSSSSPSSHGNLASSLSKDSHASHTKTSDGSGRPAPDTGSSNSSSQSDLLKLGDIFKKGFDKISETFSTKLDNVGVKFSKGIDNLHSNLDKRMTELAEPPANFDDSDGGCKEWEDASDLSDLRREFLPKDHDMSDSSSTGRSSSFFKKKNVPPPEERVGDEVDEDLANIANRCFRKPYEEAQFKTFKEKYVRPKNVEWISTPEIPFNIYRRLSGEFKSTDSSLRVVQENL